MSDFYYKPDEQRQHQNRTESKCFYQPSFKLPEVSRSEALEYIRDSIAANESLYDFDKWLYENDQFEE